MSWEIKKRFNDFEVSRQTSKQTMHTNKNNVSRQQQITMDDYPPEGVFRTSKTAVEWLVHQVNSDCLNSTFISPKLIEIANKLFKEQIERAFSDGQELPINNPLLPNYSSEEYYSDNYNK